MSDSLHAEHEVSAREQALAAAVRMAVGAFSPPPHLEVPAPSASGEPLDRPVASVVTRPSRPWT
ncbi:hypothetical protein [Mycolicibacterium sediminis]|uniref:hypothetical protein n=1 Tax=Mycolicibacterium sediminis TaxID=1286180 RepID=UPI0013D34AD7|nr:hypothetical protein [Mycolicibacterium sediminis]